MYIEEITVESNGYLDMIDITQAVKKILKENSIDNGLLGIYCEDKLCSIITIEYEYRLLNDLKKLLSQLKCENDYVKASLLKPMIILPIINSSIPLGSFQQIVLVDFNRERGNRKVKLMVIK